MVELSFSVFANLKNHRIQTVAYPADRAMLNGQISALVGVVRMKENLLRFLEADSALWIPPKALALPLIEVESHECITVIPYLTREPKRSSEKALASLPPRLRPLLVVIPDQPQLIG